MPSVTETTQATTSSSLLQGDEIASNNSSGEDLSHMFLDLLVAQVSSQNPLDPMDGTEYVSQLAEFASLESLQSLQADSSRNLQMQSSQQAIQATSLIGQQVNVPAEQIVLEQSDTISGALNLNKPAEAIYVQLVDAQGQPVAQQLLPAAASGTVNFEFEQQAAGVYGVRAEARSNNRVTPLSPLLRGQVERVSIGQSVDDIQLQVNGLGVHSLQDTNQLQLSDNS